MRDFGLVIFDCDGVLVDSERISNRVFCGMLNELGLGVTLEDMFQHFVGLSMPQCVQLITDMLGKPPPQDFVESLRNRTELALKEQVTPISGVPEMLDRIKVPFCVASSGSHDKIRLTLGATGLLDRFAGRIYSVADVNRPKPAPDVFLYAAHQMGVNPVNCVVIEDTPTGVRAGVAAGMCVLGFCANTPAIRLKEAGAHAVYEEMRYLPRLLQDAIL
ncbi:MAG TPA: HAD family hydrolase [Burkholderiales bacterium]|nr:HAD family hydrolase [Burkholderiales bacterium]